MTTPEPRPSRRPVVVIAVIAVLLLVGSIVTLAVRHGDDPGQPTAAKSATPGLPTARTAAAASTVASTYYLAVRDDNVRQAYALLCPGRQSGYDQYAGEVALNERTGTGISTFRVTAPGQVAGLNAQVPAQVSLSNGTQTPILVLLTYDSGSWKVCSSDLGGVLPGPGPGVGPTSTPTGPPAKNA